MCRQSREMFAGTVSHASEKLFKRRTRIKKNRRRNKLSFNCAFNFPPKHTHSQRDWSNLGQSWRNHLEPIWSALFFSPSRNRRVMEIRFSIQLLRTSCYIRLFLQRAIGASIISHPPKKRRNGKGCGKAQPQVKPSQAKPSRMKQIKINNTIGIL